MFKLFRDYTETIDHGIWRDIHRNAADMSIAEFFFGGVIIGMGFMLVVFGLFFSFLLMLAGAGACVAGCLYSLESYREYRYQQEKESHHECRR